MVAVWGWFCDLQKAMGWMSVKSRVRTLAGCAKHGCSCFKEAPGCCGCRGKPKAASGRTQEQKWLSDGYAKKGAQTLVLSMLINRAILELARNFELDHGMIIRVQNRLKEHRLHALCRQHHYCAGHPFLVRRTYLLTAARIFVNRNPRTLLLCTHIGSQNSSQS